MKKNVFIIILLTLIVSLTSLAELRNIMFTEPLNLKGVTLSDAIAVISEDSGLTITADEASKDKVLDLYFPAGVTLDTILNNIATSNGLKLTSVSSKNFMFITKNSAQASTLTGKIKLKDYESALDNVKVTVLDSGLPPVMSGDGGKYVIRNLLPGTYIVRFERPGFETEGEFVTVTDKNAVLDVYLSRNGEKLKTPSYENSSISKSMGSSHETTTGSKHTEKITVTNISPDEIKDVLLTTFGEDLVISSFPKLSMLILKGDPNTLKIARNIAQDMDTKLKQVRIAAQTLEITDNLFEDLGFKWAYTQGSLQTPPEQAPGPGKPIPDDDPNTINTSGSSTGILDNLVTGAGLSSSLNLVRFFNHKNDFLNFTINTLQATSDATISAIPSILVVNGEKGKFDMTEDQLISYNSVVTPTGGTGNITSTEAITGTAGIILEVTPIIKNDDSILLLINVESSNFTGNANQITPTGGYNPKVTRRLSSTVLIKNGDTIFIGGMKTASSTNGKSKLPFLGDVPVVGNLFRQNSVSNKIRDIYVKLKVDIVNSEEAKTEMNYSEFKKMELHNYPATKNLEAPEYENKIYPML